LDQPDFRLKPRQARGNFLRIWLGMNAPFPPRLPFEVFHNVGDIGEAAVDFGFLQRMVEEFAGRADKGLAGQVFVVARLLTDKEELRFWRAFAEDRLRALFPQVTSLAAFRNLADLRKRCGFRDEGGGGAEDRFSHGHAG
jgi:hypothetical protein